MGKVVVELTNRCNLSCKHCFSGRHGGRDELELATYLRLLAEAKHSGFDAISFTGGEPTLHREFASILQHTHEAGYRFGFVTNGWNFARNFRELRPLRSSLDGLTFSLDGASATTHDSIRGAQSFQRVLQAMSLCMVEGLPFTINMVVMAHNRHELAEMVTLSAQVGALGLRFCHFFAETEDAGQTLLLASEQRKAVEREVAVLAGESPITVAMAPGYHSADLFPCAPLALREVNLDWRGRLTKCCHLSGHDPQLGVGSDDVIAHLDEVGFAAALKILEQENTLFRARKQARRDGGDWTDEDGFACQYCERYYDKLVDAPHRVHTLYTLRTPGLDPKPGGR